MPELRFIDRAKETTTTNGYGTITLAGAEVGFVQISGIGDGNSAYYVLEDGNNFEIGQGRYTLDGNTLSRDTILLSSNDNSQINLGANPGDLPTTVFLTYPASFIPTISASTASCVSTASAMPISELVVSSGLTLQAASTTGQFSLGICSTGINTATGNFDRVTFNNDIVRIGRDAGNNGGIQSIHIGTLAGKNQDPDASHNISIGTLAAYGCSGYKGIYVGYQAGYGMDGDTEVNSRRVVIGDQAMMDGWEQDGTIAMGYRAGYESPSGSNNIIMGYNAAAVINNGTDRNKFSVFSDNVYIGSYAMYGAESSSASTDREMKGNVAIGRYAGNEAESLSHFSNVTFVGHYAGGNCDNAYGNTAIGNSAFREGDGAYNLSLGYNVGYGVTGQYNILLGYQAGINCVGNNNIEIVTQGAATSILNGTSNKIHIENTIVGDTTSGMLAVGNVGTGILSESSPLDYFNLIPSAMLHVLSTGIIGDKPVVHIEGTGGALMTVRDNVTTGVIFSVSDIGGVPSIVANASGEVLLAQYSNQKVGIGTGNPQYQLDVNGTGNFSSGIRFSDGTVQTTAGGGGTTYTAVRLPSSSILANTVSELFCHCAKSAV